MGKLERRLRSCSAIDAHGRKSKRGVAQIFAKIPRGGQGFQEQIASSPILDFHFYCIFINKFFKKGAVSPPPPMSKYVLTGGLG